MKQLLAFLICLLAFAPIANAQDFTVNNYSAAFFLEKDGYFTVSEKYNLTFHRFKHGIYRNIILEYDLKNEEGAFEKRKIKVSKVKVPDWNYTTTGKISNDLSGEIQIKIGDKDKTITGPQEYTINYRVDNAFLFEKDATQFYWNVKPSDWLANFEGMQFTIHLPDGVSIAEDAVKVYSGAYGTDIPTDDFDITIQGDKINLTSKDNYLSKYGGSVTVLVSLPPNVITEVKPLWPFGSNYGWTLLIGLLFGSFFVIWRKHGKDDKVIAATSYYPPKGIDPAMAGYLIYDKSDTRDLISLLPYWGSQGYITITEIENKGLFSKNDTKLNKLKDLPNTATSYERTMFNRLFGASDEILVSSLKDSFYTTMSIAKDALKSAAQPYYIQKSKAIQKKVSLFLALTLFIVTPIVLYVWGVVAAVSILISCLILFLFNILMIKKNSKGNEALSQLKGFKKFIKLAEAKRLQVLIKEDPHYFENTMAYALAFGYFEKWADKFSGLDVEPPTWYHTSTPHMFTMHTFSQSFDSAMSSARSTMVSSPSSSGSGGGGFSGGGFGGGGGGSW